MQSAKPDARWSDAIPLTVALWLFVLLIFLPVIIFDRYSLHDWPSILLDSATIIISILLGLGTFVGFRATIDWPTTLRLVALCAAALLAAVVQTWFDTVYSAWVAGNLEASWATVRFTGSYEKIFRYLLVFAVNIVLFQLATSRRGSRRSERQLTDARSAAQQAQLQALRYQLNPHFLFNTLNSISSLIVTRRNEDAEEMTSKLSSFLRSSLTCDPDGLVPLDDELALIEEYLDIEGVRFGERLKVEFTCDADAGSMLIPSFLVQPLVENAIKHAVAPSRDPVTISISATVADGLLTIKIENDHPEPEGHVSSGAGVGLTNVRRRLAAVYGERASLTTERDGDAFRAVISIAGAMPAA
jgi:histidine kinase/histidine kinase/DNA gyrase B/HSP90-like ATPase